MDRKINFDVFVHPDKYLLFLSIEKITADTKVKRQIVERYKRKIVNGESILPIVVIKNPGKDIYAVLDGHHRYFAYFELGVKDVKCAYAGNFSGLFFFMVGHGFFQPAVEIVVRTLEVPVVVHKNVKYYFGVVSKYLSFQKLRNFVLGIISTPMKWSTKGEDTKNEGSKFKVLFVCTANAYRSPICEALLKKLRPELMVDSAGTKIKIPNRITNEARKYLKQEDAIQYLKKTPESIDSKQVDQYDIVIVMEQEHKDIVLKKYPECKDKIVVWDIHDKIPFLNKRTEKINKQMKKNVIAYSESLACYYISPEVTDSK
jgi:protein-tyrosine phosphatase